LAAACKKVPRLEWITIQNIFNGRKIGVGITNVSSRIQRIVPPAVVDGAVIEPSVNGIATCTPFQAVAAAATTDSGVGCATEEGVVA